MASASSLVGCLLENLRNNELNNPSCSCNVSYVLLINETKMKKEKRRKKNEKKSKEKDERKKRKKMKERREKR